MMGASRYCSIAWLAAGQARTPSGRPLLSEGRTLMDQIQKTAFPMIGVIFLGLGVFNFIRGDNWIVWVLLGALFGGLSVFSRRRR